jgi:DNA-binding NarL/FixJ family response regulator
MDKMRVMLVDDHTVVRAGLRLLVNAQADMEVVAEAASCEDALSRAPAARPDVLILDLSLPGGASLPLIDQLRSAGLNLHTLVLSMHDDPAYVRAALAAGATGYVVKTIAEKTLTDAIRAVHSGRMFVDLDDEARTASVFQTLPRHPGPGTRAVAKLSEREVEVLRLLGQGVTNQEIADRLDLSPKTVATYKSRIADKLGLKTTADFVKFAVDTGLLGPEHEPG